MITLNEKFKPLFSTGARFILVTGGRGSAKSFGVGTFASLLSFEVGHKILFTRQTMTSAHLSIIPEFQEKVNLLNAEAVFTIDKSEITNLKSGSQIYFRGIKTASGDQTANLKSLQGVTTWILDEAEEQTDESKFDDINLSIRQKGKQNRVILILNPTTKEHWIYKRFFESTGVEPGWNGTKGNVTYIHTNYLDNIDNLDESFINECEELKTKNPQKYQHKILGGWLQRSEGVVFNNWTLGEFKEVSVSVYGQDFGFSIDPTTLVKTSIDRSNKVIYLKECFYTPKLTTSEIYELNKIYAGKSLIYADSAEPRLIAELKRLGCNIVECVKGQGSVSAGIAMLQDYQLLIDPESINLIKELNHYCWNDRKSGTPIDAYNHLIDPIRYAIQGQLSRPKPTGATVTI